MIFGVKEENSFIKILNCSIFKFSLSQHIIKECDNGTKGTKKETGNITDVLKFYFICMTIPVKLFCRFSFALWRQDMVLFTQLSENACGNVCLARIRTAFIEF